MDTIKKTGADWIKQKQFSKYKIITPNGWYDDPSGKNGWQWYNCELIDEETFRQRLSISECFITSRY